MNIAHVSPRYLPAQLRGGEQYVRTLSENLSDMNNVTVLTSNSHNLFGNLGIPGNYYLKQRTEVINNVNVIRFPVAPLVSTTLKKMEFLIEHVSSNYQAYSQLDYLRVLAWGPLTPSMCTHISSSNYDIIHAVIWPTTTLMLSFQACKKSRMPFVTTPFYHFGLAEFSQSSLLRYVLHYSTAVIAMTKRERIELLKIGASPKRTFIIPLSINISNFPMGSGDSFRQKYDLNGKFIVLTHPWMSKGAGIILLTLKELAKVFPNLALITIGNPDQEYLSALASIKPLNFKVVNLGWVYGQIKLDAFAASDVFVMLSISDAFGMVYLEAWASEKPVIGLRNTAAEDIIKHGQDGYLMDDVSVDGLRSLLSLLVSNPDLVTQMGKKGRGRIEKDFSATKNCHNFIEAIEASLKLGLPY